MRQLDEERELIKSSSRPSDTCCSDSTLSPTSTMRSQDTRRTEHQASGIKSIDQVEHLCSEYHRCVMIIWRVIGREYYDGPICYDLEMICLASLWLQRVVKSSKTCWELFVNHGDDTRYVSAMRCLSLAVPPPKPRRARLPHARAGSQQHFACSDHEDDDNDSASSAPVRDDAPCRTPRAPRVSCGSCRRDSNDASRGAVAHVLERPSECALVHVRQCVHDVASLRRRRQRARVQVPRRRCA